MSEDRELQGDVKTRELLRAAKERLLTLGWCQGKFGDKEGPNCGAGAVLFAAGEDPNNAVFSPVRPTTTRWPNVSSALAALKIVSESENLDVGDANGFAAWQDQPGITRGDVLAMFDRAIEMSYSVDMK